ncbi:MAG: SagB/ThcOx family dehydrogenase [Candidatus Bathyarchaeia archaeon]
MKKRISRRGYVRYAGSSMVVVAGASAGAYYLGRHRSTPASRRNRVGETDEISPGGRYLLPLPRFTRGVVGEAVAWRRSIREYRDEPIPVEQLSELLWAAQGVNELKHRLRTVPSAGATYPLELYVVAGDGGVLVDKGRYLPAGSYKYDRRDHSLVLVALGDLRERLAGASLNQEWVKNAPINIVICAVYERTTVRYGERGLRYVYMEVGHVGQNIYIVASALGLGTVAVGAFHDGQVKTVLGAEAKEEPLYVMPVGVPEEPYRISEEDLSDNFQKMRRS